MIKFLAIFCLLHTFLLQSMEKPPSALVRVCNIEQTHTWELQEDVVEQITILSNQKKDNPGLPLMLTPAVTDDNFNQLLSLAGQKKVKKKLRRKTTAELAQLARDTDCLGAKKVLSRSLRILCARASDDPIPELPETLGQTLGHLVVRKNHYFKRFLFNAYSLAYPDQNKRTISTKVGFSNGLVILQQQGQLPEKIDPNGILWNWNEGYHFIHEPHLKKAIIFSEENIIFVDMIEKKLIREWRFTRKPEFLWVYKNGAIVKLQYAQRSWHAEDTPTYVCDIRRAEPYVLDLAKEFLWANPEALALNKDGTKLIVGSGNGFIVMYDLTDSEFGLYVYNAKDWELVKALGPNPVNRPGIFIQRGWISAIAVDDQENYIAACSINKGLELYSLRGKPSHQLSKINSAGLKFNTTGDLLFELSYYGDTIRIWSVNSKILLHSIVVGNPSVYKTSDNVINSAIDDSCVTVRGHFAEQIKTITLFDEAAYKQLQCAPFTVIALLARIGKRIKEDKKMSADDEKELQRVYEFLPASMQQIIKPVERAVS